MLNSNTKMLCLFILLVCVVCREGSVITREKREACSTVPVTLCQMTGGCRNGGTCVLNNETCFVECACPPGFSGEKCQNADSACDTTPVTLCQMTGSCRNGGTCTINSTTCYVMCSCAPGFSGDKCQDEDSGTSTASQDIPGNSTLPIDTPDNSTESEPQVNITCQFPICILNNPCLNNGKCIQDDSCRPVCDCPANYTGELCENAVSPTITNANEPTTTPTTKAPMRPLEERQCVPGFRCFYGKCVNENGSYYCECDKGHTGLFCHTPCAKECGEKGYCDRVNNTAPENCVCEYPYSGDTCDDIVQVGPLTEESDEWKYWIVGSCLTVLVVLILLLLLAYMLLRKRNIFIMRVLYYFQPYEDDDGKLFDAFISYKSSPEDEHFVYRVLYPELEKKRGFRLCLHQRDFTPGETIANNILWAIENSRRTILILSPSYMESDFTRFEYQIAHNEMLKQKHKVIPLLLENFDHQKNLMDRTLENILKSITYLEWPGTSSDISPESPESQMKRTRESGEDMTEKFWTRLELSLPKKKKSSELSAISDFSPKPYDNLALEYDDITINVDQNAGQELSTEGGQDSIEMSKMGKTGEGKEIKQEDPKTIGELKSFFNEPVNDDLFIRMRDRALEYEDTLDV